jgi:hypothetical protein
MARTKQTLRRFQPQGSPVWTECSAMLAEVCKQVDLPFPDTKPADIITHLTRDWGVDLSHCKDFDEKARAMYCAVSGEQPKKKRRVAEVSRPGSPTPAHKALTKDSSIQEVKSWALLLDVDKDIKEEIATTVQKQDATNKEVVIKRVQIAQLKSILAEPNTDKRKAKLQRKIKATEKELDTLQGLSNGGAGSPTPAHKALTKDSSIQEVKSWALLLDVDKDIKEEIASTVQKQDVDGEFLFCLLDNLNVGGCADIIEVKKTLGLSAGAAYYLNKHLQCLKE